MRSFCFVKRKEKKGQRKECMIIKQYFGCGLECVCLVNVELSFMGVVVGFVVVIGDCEFFLIGVIIENV